MHDDIVGTPYLRDQAENSVKAYRNSSHNMYAFANELVEEEGTVFSERDIVISTCKLSQLEYKSKCLLVMELFQFVDDSFE